MKDRIPPGNCGTDFKFARTYEVRSLAKRPLGELRTESPYLVSEGYDPMLEDDGVNEPAGEKPLCADIGL